MTVDEILDLVAQVDGRLVPNGDKLIMEAPQPFPDELRQAIRQHKSELLELLQVDTPKTKSPLGKVGHHGNPCKRCSGTWQWPATEGAWICSLCFVGGIVTKGLLHD